MYFIVKDENEKVLLFADNREQIERDLNIQPKWQDYEIEETETEYVLDDELGFVEKNAEWEERQRQKKRQRLDALILTPADVERALYKEKQMDFDDLKALISQQLPQVDIKGLAIEFRAKDFFRGAEASGMRLFDVVGALLGYTPEDMDYLFEHKELPANNEE